MTDPAIRAALVEAAARGIDEYRNPYSKPSDTRHLLHANTARAALAAMLRAAGVDRQALLNDAAHLDLSVAKRRRRETAKWGDTDPERTTQMARTAALLRSLAEVADE